MKLKETIVNECLKVLHRDDVKEEFKQVNVIESKELADCFFREEFLEGQRAFLASRGKSQPALMFSILKWTRPIWKHLLP